MSPSNTVPDTENARTSLPITTRLHPDEVAKAERYARQDQRTRAGFLRVLILRGLASYEKERDISVA